MPFKHGNPGCPCCIVACTGLTRICATVRYCNSSGIPAEGLTVTVSKDGSTVGTAVTDSSGLACIEVGEAGSYDVSIEGDCGTGTATVTVACDVDNEVDVVIPGVDFTLNIVSDCPTAACGTTGFPALTDFVITGPGGFEFHIGSFIEGVPISICLPVFGAYTISWDGYCDSAFCYDAVTEGVTIGACTASHTLHIHNKQYLVTVTALGCLSTPSPDISVTISSPSGGGGSGTTDADGTFSALVPALCEYSVTVGGGRYQETTSTGYVMPCGDVELSFSPAVASGYVCFCNCKNPVKAWPGGSPKFQVTDSTGTHSLGSDLLSDCLTASSKNVRCFTLGARCCGGSYTASVPYQYELKCQDGKVTLVRYTSACGNTTDPDCISGDGTFALMASSCNPTPGASPTFQSATTPGGCAVPGASAVPAVAIEAVQLTSADCGGAAMDFTFTFGWSETVSVTEEP